MLLSPVSKLGVWFNFPLWSCSINCGSNTPLFVGWAVLLNCGSNTPLFVGWAVPLIQMLLSPVSKLGVWFNFPLWSCSINCGSNTPLFVGWAVPLIQMSNQMLWSPVSKLGVWLNFPLWSCIFFYSESQRHSWQGFDLDFGNKHASFIWRSEIVGDA